MDGSSTPEKIVERPSPLTGLARSGIGFAAAAVIIGRELLESGPAPGRVAIIMAIAAVLIAVIGGISGVISARTTSFIADDDEFRVEKNFISSSSSRVDYTKVQSIDITQPFVARLLGLAKLHIDVGGAGGVDLAYLTKARAESLREHLLSRMQRAISRETPTSTDETVETPQPEQHEELVVRVPARNLLLGSLLSVGAITSALVAAVFITISIVTRTPMTVLGGVLAVGGWVWSQLGANWGFTMTRQGSILRLRRGLLSTTTQGLHPERIQAVAIRQDLVQRITGLYQVSVTVLGYGEPSGDEGSDSNAIVLPFGTWDQVITVLHALWPGLDLASIEPHPQPARARWLTPLNFDTHTWGIGEDVVIAQHGLLAQIRSIVPHRRMQSASLEQGPLQRRLRLATVAIHTTDGPVTLRLNHIDQQVARTVFFDQLERARQARLAAHQ